MKLFNKEKKPSKNIVKPKSTMAEVTMRDWKLMLIVFTVLIVCAVGIDGYLSVRVNRGDFFVVEPESTVNPATAGRKSLLDADNFFVNREKEYENFKASAVPEIDPSI